MSETATPLPEITRCSGPDGLALACRHAEGDGPLIVFLPGYMSDMAGSKAEAVLQWAADHGRACLLLDYSGCGKSAGRFADGTLSRWRDEVLHLIEQHGAGTPDRPVLLIGSSMGGWLMLLAGMELGDRLAGLVGIAPAPDFTEWGRSDTDKDKLAAGETVYDDNPYGPEPTPTHPGFFADGQSQLLLGSEIPIEAPVRLIHGQRDDDVPWDISTRLAEALRSDDIQVTLIKDGDHRLSRDQDIALILQTVEALSKGPS